jgi:hypothetical protein
MTIKKTKPAKTIIAWLFAWVAVSAINIAARPGTEQETARME